MGHQILGQLQDVFLQCYLEAGRRFASQNVGIDDSKAHEKKKWCIHHFLDLRLQNGFKRDFACIIACITVSLHDIYVNLSFSKIRYRI